MTSPVEIYARVLVCSPSAASVYDFDTSLPGIPGCPTKYGMGSPDPNNSVQVTIRLGHTAQLRKKPTLEGFTHDWKVFVRGPEGGNIQNFVEKVVFYLHESFPKSKRVVKDPPYEVSESGYAGFELPIDIYFKSKSEPRKIRFNYDLFLQLSDSPPVHHIRCEKLTFQNPLEDFKQRLLLSGGVYAGGGEHIKPENTSSKINPGKIQKSSEPTDSKPEPTKPAPPIVSKVFTDLFGSPLTKEDITTSKKTASKPAAFASSKEKKEKEREKSSSSHSKSSGGKNASNLSTSSPSTPPTGKDKHSSSSSSHKHKEKHDKDKQKHSKDKDKGSNKRTVESPPSAEELSSKKKKRIDSSDRSPPDSKSKEKDKSNKSITVKNEKESKDVQVSSSKHSSHKYKSSKKDKSETEIKEIKKEKDASHDSKSKHHKHDKHDKEKRHSKDKERHHKDSPSNKSFKKEDFCKSPAKSEKIAKSSDKNTKKPSPPNNRLLPFADELSTGELSDFDPFSDKPSKRSPGSCSQSFNSPKTVGASHGIGSFVEESDSSDSDSDLLSPLDEKSPPNIFSQHTPKASPNKSPASQSDRSTPTPQGSSQKQSPSQKGHNTSKPTKSKYKDKDTNASSSKKVKLERKPSKESKSAISSNVDSDSLKHRINEVNGLPHFEKTAPRDRLEKDMNSFPDLGGNGDHLLEIDNAPNGESLSVLVELQQRLMTANDNTLLRQVVALIKETGQFNIDDNMFNFDLCNLDKMTVQKLQTCLLTT